jgi:hypothetical protein
MNKLRLDQATGQKLIREDLAFLDEAYREAFTALGSALGNHIISGCNVTIAAPNIMSVTAGYVYLNGEIYKVDAGIVGVPLAAAYWQIDETDAPEGNRLHDDGNLYQVKKIRKAKIFFFQGVASFSSVKTYIERIREIAEYPGIIKMWHGTIATIPTGYALCNGSNGTPDLRNSFIVGAGSDSNNANYYRTGGNANTTNSKYSGTGGADHVTLSGAQSGLPEHNHTVNSHSHEIPYAGTSPTTAGVSSGSNFTALGFSGAFSIQQPGSSGSIGGSTANSEAQDAVQEHENRPTYYALAYIVKL